MTVVAENPWLEAPFETPPFDRHIDEYAWYHYTYHYDLFFHQRAFDFESWGADVPSIGQPNMVKYFLGAELEAHGIAVNTSAEKMRRWWQPFTDDGAFKVFLAENLPFSDNALLVGRFYSAVFTYLAVVLSVVYVARISNLATAVLFGLFIAHLPFLHTTRMMADSYSLFSFLLSILLFDVIATWRGGTISRMMVIVLYSVVVSISMGIKLANLRSRVPKRDVPYRKSVTLTMSNTDSSTQAPIGHARVADGVCIYSLTIPESHHVR